MSYTVTSADIAKLREMTNCGLLDCKKALTEKGGNFDEAADHLRKQGLAKAAKKADREAKEGMIALSSNGKTGSLIQISCETDFVANNDRFQAILKSFAADVAALAANGDVTESFGASKAEELIPMIHTIGENMKVVVAAKWEAGANCSIGSYLHGNSKVGVLVEVEGEVAPETLKALGMHIAAYKPSYLCPACIPEADTAREKEVQAEKTKGKPEAMVAKILEGALNKWHSDVCLVKQAWIHDDKITVEKALGKAKITRFLLAKVG